MDRDKYLIIGDNNEVQLMICQGLEKMNLEYICIDSFDEIKNIPAEQFCKCYLCINTYKSKNHNGIEVKISNYFAPYGIPTTTIYTAIPE